VVGGRGGRACLWLDGVAGEVDRLREGQNRCKFRTAHAGGKGGGSDGIFPGPAQSESKAQTSEPNKEQPSKKKTIINETSTLFTDMREPQNFGPTCQ
jgi:hypothetical protein